MPTYSQQVVDFWATSTTDANHHMSMPAFHAACLRLCPYAPMFPSFDTYHLSLSLKPTQ